MFHSFYRRITKRDAQQYESIIGAYRFHVCSLRSFRSYAGIHEVNLKEVDNNHEVRAALELVYLQRCNREY